METSCNNCTLKEKEQVYTAARDGNLMYLKVSLGLEPGEVYLAEKLAAEFSEP